MHRSRFVLLSVSVLSSACGGGHNTALAPALTQPSAISSREFTLSGRIVDVDSDAVPGALVDVRSGDQHLTSMSDRNGGFVVRGSATADAIVTVTKAGFREHVEWVALEGEVTLNVLLIEEQERRPRSDR